MSPAITSMRTLVYKRTHNGDPDNQGCFGVYDCMGRVRSLDFDAVIGIGGIGSEAIAAGIDGKINWIGIGPTKKPVLGYRGPIVTFERFLDFGLDGPVLRTIAPALASRMYAKHGPRYLLRDISDPEQAEINRILSSIVPSPAEPGFVRVRSASSRKCNRSATHC